MRWYIIEGRSYRDVEAILLHLALSSAEVFWPVDYKERADRRSQAKRRKGHIPIPTGPRRSATKTPRFGRYFFLRCAMTDSLYHVIADSRHVQTWVCFPATKDPYPVPDEQIAFLRNHEPGKPKAGWEMGYYRGRRVTVAAGPFEGMSGIVTALDKRGILRVDLDNKFGRPVPIIVEIGHVVENAELSKTPRSTDEAPKARFA